MSDNNTTEHLLFVREMQRFVDEECDVLQIKYHHILDYIHRPNTGLNDRTIIQLALAAKRMELASRMLKDSKCKNSADVNLKIAEETLINK